jgi:hypothetical protein
MSQSTDTVTTMTAKAAPPIAVVTAQVAGMTVADWVQVATLIYAQKRRGAYPPVADYLDGIVKGDAAQVSKYIADCLAVKALYPKPAN